MSSDLIDYYALLGVDAAATVEEIMAAFRRAALRQHPDKHPRNGFAEANAAFLPYLDAMDVLTQPDCRARYDSRYATHVGRPHSLNRHKARPGPYHYNPDPYARFHSSQRDVEKERIKKGKEGQKHRAAGSWGVKDSWGCLDGEETSSRLKSQKYPPDD